MIFFNVDYSSLNDSVSNSTINSSLLFNAINKTLFASGNDELRPVMSGVFCEFSAEKISFVATDAHKLVCHSRTDITADSTASFILPRKPLRNLLSKEFTKEILKDFWERAMIEKSYGPPMNFW